MPPNSLGIAGNLGNVVPAGSDHDLVGGAVASRGRNLEDRPDAPHAAHAHPLAKWGIERCGIRFEVRDDLVLFHEPVWIGTRVRKAGEATLPIGGHQAEGVPTTRSPLMAQPVFFEHHVIDSRLFQAIAHREAGLPASDDHDTMVGRERRFVAVEHDAPTAKSEPTVAAGSGPCAVGERRARYLEQLTDGPRMRARTRQIGRGVIYFRQTLLERQATNRLMVSSGLPQASSRMAVRHVASCFLSMPAGHSLSLRSSRLSSCMRVTQSARLEYFSLVPTLLQRTSRSHRADAIFRPQNWARWGRHRCTVRVLRLCVRRYAFARCSAFFGFAFVDALLLS